MYASTFDEIMARARRIKECAESDIADGLITPHELRIQIAEAEGMLNTLQLIIAREGVKKDK